MRPRRVSFGDLPFDCQSTNIERFSPPRNTFTAEALLFRENQLLKGLLVCKVCLLKYVETLFVPCCHLSCCQPCSVRLKDCPVCRERIRGTLKLYLT